MNMTSLFPNGYSVLAAIKEPQDFDGVPGIELPFFDLFGGEVENAGYLKICTFNSYLVACFRCFYKEKPIDASTFYGNRVFRGECVELFIGSRNEYYELDVSPYNVRFFALIDENGQAIEQTDLGISTVAKWGDGSYEILYKIPLSKLKRWEKLYFNAFRVEGICHEERFSRSVWKTDSLLHHVPAAFKRLKFHQ